MWEGDKGKVVGYQENLCGNDPADDVRSYESAGACQAIRYPHEYSRMFGGDIDMVNLSTTCRFYFLKLCLLISVNQTIASCLPRIPNKLPQWMR